MNSSDSDGVLICQKYHPGQLKESKESKDSEMSTTSASPEWVASAASIRRKVETENLLAVQKLGMTNPLSGFPLLPTTIASATSASKDYLVEKMCNTGLLAGLSEVIEDKMANSSSGTASASRGLNKLVTESKMKRGLPYDVKEIGPRLNISESKCLPGRAVEMRTIGVTPNAQWASSSDDCAKSIEKTLSNVIHIPIVSDLPWKKLAICLAKKFPKERDLILKQLTVPTNQCNPIVIAMLLKPENREIMEMFNLLRTELNDLNNGAYVETMIHALLSYLSFHNWAPLFPRVYGTIRGQEPSAVHHDPAIPPTWKQVVFTQYCENYCANILAMEDKLDLEQLMADMLQVVFGLDAAQHTLGFIHGDFDARKALAFIKIDKDVYLQLKWRGKFYRPPSGGRLMKILNLEHSSVMLNDVQHTSEKLAGSSSNSSSSTSNGANASGGNGADSFNTDLVRLGATMRKVLAEKQLKVFCEHPEVERAFNTMIDQWVNCGNPFASKSDTSSSSSSSSSLDGFSSDFDALSATLASSPRNKEMQATHLKCLQADTENGICTWRNFGKVPHHQDCKDAVPYAQQHFFEMFRVDESEIDPRFIVYSF